MKIQSILPQGVDKEALRARFMPVTSEEKPQSAQSAPQGPAQGAVQAATQAPPGGVAPVGEATAEPARSQSNNSDLSREVERIAEDIKKFIKENSSALDFTVDKDLQQIVTKVMKEERVVRQYPPEIELAVMRRLKEYRGSLVDEKG